MGLASGGKYAGVRWMESPLLHCHPLLVTLLSPPLLSPLPTLLLTPPDLSSPASPDFNTFSLLADLDDRQTTVPMSAFAESYVRSDPDDWCARMVLLDRIAAVQDLIVQRMAVIEKEIEGRRPCVCVSVCTLVCVAELTALWSLGSGK